MVWLDSHVRSGLGSYVNHAIKALKPTTVHLEHTNVGLNHATPLGCGPGATLNAHRSIFRLLAVVITAGGAGEVGIGRFWVMDHNRDAGEFQSHARAQRKQRL